jgi:probable F420-dependent oxidoreductase
VTAPPAAGPGAGPRFGLIFPTTEIGGRLEDVVAVAAAAEEVGLDYLVIYDHVVSADPEAHPGWSGPYTIEHTFHEPMTTLAYLAGRTGLELMTGVLVLPQRQAVLVAKQAAQLSLLTGGRFVLGVGTGWNELEYRALGVPFAHRGRRMEEQIDVMRQLWAVPSLSFTGDLLDLDGVGMSPLPAGGSIPVWIGSRTSGPGLRRVGRLADGWISMDRPGPAVAAATAEIRRTAEAAGRDPGSLAFQGMVQRLTPTAADLLEDTAEEWLALGLTRVSFSGLRAGRSPAGHLEFVHEAGEAVARLRARHCRGTYSVV